MSTTSVPTISARDMSAGAILRDVDLSLTSGFVGVVGSNGAGKTTLLRALAGVIAHQGTIELFGDPVESLAPAERARRIAYLPQIASVSWPVSARDLVALGRLPHGDGERPIGQDAVTQALGATGTQHLEGRRVDTLSGGERARVMLARALAVEAPVLIADEPIAALDPRYQIEIMLRLRAIADAGTLVIAASHDLALAARHCDTVLLLQAGRITADGPPSAVLTRERVEEAFGLQFKGSDDYGPVWEPTTP
ncbi:ABC transporter ATP-binding protein [Tepidamorphus sp. 3E244]|uniref:ABC transporter ATP-binding protein n=1 Tax=Tepidamorphus sp. 3E244 TaxID=3385498 RepID=UPI0038FBECC2